MAISRPVTKTLISTTDWGIPVTDAINALDAEFITFGGVRRPRGAAWGQVGFASTPTSQNGIGTTEVDLTGLSVTTTPPANRQLLITANVRIYTGTAGVAALRINVNGTNVMEFSLQTGSGFAMMQPIMVVPSTGLAMTIKLRGAINTGTFNTSVSSAIPGFVLVQDIGPI